MINAPKTYLSVSEAAAILELSQATIRRLYDDGELQGFRLPGGEYRRIMAASVVDFQKRHGIRAAPTPTIEA